MSRNMKTNVFVTSVNGVIPVEKFVMAESGITVVIAQVDGPLVSGFLCLATECHDNDGLPHTLEHLIFLGSEEYPYKGILDQLANRCMSSGTNAWTDTDHTCYTMTTAGPEGFYSLLPIYLDHILFASLTDSAYITEVHHIDGEGQDAGVVYAEMQGVENKAGSLINLEMLRSLYDETCGYRYETGGIMANLRSSTSVNKVRNYHRDFYVPENLFIIVTGNIDSVKLINCLHSIEDKIAAKKRNQISHGQFVRPWTSIVPPFVASVSRTIEFPACDDEEPGEVCVSWRGCSVVDDLPGLFATICLMEYLTETSVSLLKSVFVESELDAMASDVDYNIIENRESAIYLTFEDVPQKHIDAIEDKLMQTLTSFASGLIFFDVKRMTTVIRRRIIKQISEMEDNPHEAVASMVIGHMLYGSNNDQQLMRRLNSVDQYRELLLKSTDFWRELTQGLLVNAPRAVIKGRASLARFEANSKAESQRLEIQRQELGENGLEEKRRILAEAISNNETLPPANVLTSVSVPSIDSIKHHFIKSYTRSTIDVAEIGNFDLIPFQAQFDHVKSNFIYINCLLDTRSVPKSLLVYLPLILELFLESPIIEDGLEIGYEDVLAARSAQTVETIATLGIKGERFIPGKYSKHFVYLHIKVEIDKYLYGVQWLRKFLWQIKFVPERIKVVATKMEGSINGLKREGSKIVHLLMQSLLHRDTSDVVNASGLLKQQKFLTEIINTMDWSNVLENLEIVRSALIDSVQIFVAANFDDFEVRPIDTWTSVWADLNLKKRCEVNPTFTHDDLTALVDTKPDHVLLSLNSIESSYLILSVVGITDCQNPDLPPLLLCIQYMCQLEGPLWRKIRGLGLAYHCSIAAVMDQGRLQLRLYRCTNLELAFEKTRDILHLLADKNILWDVVEFSNAKSSLVFELVEKEKDIGDVVIQSILWSLQSIDAAFSRELLLNKIMSTSIEDVKRVAAVYLPRLFDASQSKLAIICPPIRVEKTIEAFSKLNYVISHYKQLVDSPMGL